MNKKILSKEFIEFSGNEIVVLKKRIKNINLTVRADGSINLSVPFKLSDKEIHKFLESKKEWIKKSKSKFKEIEEKELKYINGEKIKYLGLEYILNIKEVDSKQRIEINGEYLDIDILKKNNNSKYLEKFLFNWYKENLEYIVTDLTEIWAEQMSLEFKEINLRKLKRTWGSCKIKEKKITYSVYLAEKSRDLIEYVVVHELAHLIYPNHGKEFKALLTKLMPDWKIRKKELNNMRVD